MEPIRRHTSNGEKTHRPRKTAEGRSRAMRPGHTKRPSERLAPRVLGAAKEGKRRKKRGRETGRPVPGRAGVGGGEWSVVCRAYSH